MSLINEALKKAEKEKGKKEPRPFDSQESGGVPSRKLGFGILQGVGIQLATRIALIGFFMVIVFFVLLSKKGSFPKKETLPQPVAEQTPQTLVPQSETDSPPPPSSSPSPVSLPVKTSPLPSEVKGSPLPTPSLRSIPIAMDGAFILNGIIEGQGENFAIINNQITRIGDQTDGATLLEVKKDSVLIEKEGEKFFLKMR